MADYTISSIVTPNGDVCHIKPYNLEVGARNLLRFSLNPIITYTGGNGGYQRKQTVDEWGCTNAFRVYGTSGSSRAFYIGGQTATIANGKNISESGQSYAMSVWVKNAHATNSVIVCTPLGGERVLAPGESARCAFVVEGDGLNNLEIDFKPTAPPSEYDVYFWHAKIEIGTVATDWLPAPEDADESYLALTGKPTEDQTPGFGETVEVSQVKTDSGGRVTNLTARTIKIPDSEATQSAAGLMSAADKTRLDGLEVGGRNLLLNSADPVIHASGSSTFTVTKNQSVSAWNANTAIKVAGTGGSSMNVFYVGGTSADIAYNSSISLSGQKYAFGVYVKNNHATNYIGVRTNPYGNISEFFVAPGTGRFITNTATGNGSSVLQIVFRVQNIGDSFDVTFWHPKIELGTFATDWTPAVEDKADNVLAGPLNNGLLSMLDWSKLQFNSIPKNIDVDVYNFEMGVYWASSYIASTLTNYPTSRDSVFICFGEPDYQYQIVMEVDRNEPKIYGRPVYLYDPWSWKELHWFDTATTSSNGLMSAADKTKVNRLEFTRIAADNTTPWATIGGKTANQALRVVRDQGTGNNWVPSQYASGITFGEADTHGYLGVSYTSTIKPTLALAGGSTSNSTDTSPYWYMKIQGTNGNTYDLDNVFDKATAFFSSIRNTTNTTAGSGFVRKSGDVVVASFSVTVAAVAANTWFEIATMPSRFAPNEETFGVVATNTSALNAVKASVLPSGVIQISSGTAISSGAVVRGTLTWCIEADLPSAYQRVEYIAANNASPYIDTGITVTGELQTEIHYYNSKSEGFLFGARQSTSGPFNNFNIESNGTSSRYDYLSKSYSSSGGFGSGSHDGEFLFTFKNRYGTLQKTDLSFSATKTYNDANFPAYTDRTVLLFASRTGSTVSTGVTAGSLRIYSAKFWLGGTYTNGTIIGASLVRNFVPCIRKSDNKYGMYDTVTGTFYTSANSSSFSL